QGRFEEAVACYRQALGLNPDLPEAHDNLAMALLQLGNFAEGWREHEWRWHPRRQFPQPLWDGGDLAGRTILLHAEQGLGDTIQFARYAPLVAQRGATVVLEVQRALGTLLHGMTGVSK